jgi:murein DD-endopeptidase MepM/ murein hydrolase activator NlpD
MSFYQPFLRGRVFVTRVAPVCGMIVVLPLLGCGSVEAVYDYSGGTPKAALQSGAYAKPESVAVDNFATVPTSGTYAPGKIERTALAPVAAPAATVKPNPAAAASQPSGGFALGAIQYDAPKDQTRLAANDDDPTRVAGNYGPRRQAQPYAPDEIDDQEVAPSRRSDYTPPPGYQRDERQGYGGDYVVRPGDTLYAIAEQHGLNVDELSGMNSLRGADIYPGQRLRVDGGGPAYQGRPPYREAAPVPRGYREPAEERGAPYRERQTDRRGDDRGPPPAANVYQPRYDEPRGQRDEAEADRYQPRAPYRQSNQDERHRPGREQVDDQPRGYDGRAPDYTSSNTRFTPDGPFEPSADAPWRGETEWRHMSPRAAQRPDPEEPQFEVAPRRGPTRAPATTRSFDDRPPYQAERRGLDQAERRGLDQAERRGLDQAERRGLDQAGRRGPDQAERRGPDRTAPRGQDQAERWGPDQAERRGPDQAERPGPAPTPRITRNPDAGGRNAAPSGSYAYTVQRGDTLREIARRNGIDAGELAEMNGMPRDSRLKAGQNLRIPRGEGYDLGRPRPEASNQAAPPALQARPVAEAPRLAPVKAPYQSAPIPADAVAPRPAPVKEAYQSAPFPPDFVAPRPVPVKGAYQSPPFRADAVPPQAAPVKEAHQAAPIPADAASNQPAVRTAKAGSEPVRRRPTDRPAPAEHPAPAEVVDQGAPPVKATAAAQEMPASRVAVTAPNEPTTDLAMNDPAAAPATTASAHAVTERVGTRECEAALANPEARSAKTFRMPVQGMVVTKFGAQNDGSFNDGINFSVPKGTPVKAAENGVVAYAGDELAGFGNLVLIRHSDGFVTAYAHNDELLVRKCDVVKRGQIISKAGASGKATAPQLHFELRKDSKPMDPDGHFSGT